MWYFDDAKSAVEEARVGRRVRECDEVSIVAVVEDPTADGNAIVVCLPDNDCIVLGGNTGEPRAGRSGSRNGWDVEKEVKKWFTGFQRVPPISDGCSAKSVKGLGTDDEVVVGDLRRGFDGHRGTCWYKDIG